MGFESDGDGPVLFVHAHPDDETISTGGTIALLTDAGIPVCILSCTRGEQGEVVQQDLKHLQGDGKALAAQREREIAEAMSILGVSDHRFLGSLAARDPRREPRLYEDSGMQWGEIGAEALPSLGENTLSVASMDELIDDVIMVIDEIRPRAVVSYDSTGGYGHPDHVTAHQISLAAAQECGVPFLEIVPGDADFATGSDPTLREVDATGVLERKVAALRAYRTQLTVGDGTITHTGGQSQPIEAVERFRELSTPGADIQKDFRPTLAERLTPSVLAVVAGIALGFLGTSVHSLSVTVLGKPVWTGAIFALLALASLLSGLRLYYNNRWPAGWAVIGVLTVVGVLSLEGPGGSVLIPANDPGWLWAYGPIIIALVALAWPKLASRRRDTMELSSAQRERCGQL